jgi:glycerophosphoryl diester phosphodiesterase
VLTFFRENFRLLKQGHGLLRFELFYKLVGIGILVPSVLALLNLSLRVAGLTYLTNDNFVRYLTHPAGILLAIIVFAGWGFYNLTELAGLTICFYAASQGRKMAARQIFTAGIRCAGRLFRPRNFWMFPFMVIIVPLTILPLLFAYGATIQIPEFILRYIRTRWWMIGILLALLAALFILSVRWIFSLCFFCLEKRSFPQARRDSVILLRGFVWKTVWRLLIWQTVLMVAFFLAYFVFLGFALLISKIFIAGTLGMQIFIGVFQWCNLGLLLIGLCLTLPMCSIAVSQLYLTLKKQKKERLVPLKSLDIPKGRAIQPKLKWGIFAVLTVLTAWNAGYIFPAVSRGTFGFVEGLSKPWVTAHRGDSESAPENTIAAFKRAVENGADMIELDVQQLSDGALILLHDSNFRRTAGVSLNTWEATLPMVQEMEVGSWFSEKYAGEPIPTLAETLEFARENRIRLNIELKYTGHEASLEKDVAALIEEYDMQDQCVVTSMQYSVLKRVKEANPDIVTGYILSVAYGPFYGMEYADLFSVRADFVTMGMVRGLHNSGKRIYVWTVNDESNIERLIDMRVDSIITDNVPLARGLVDKPAGNAAILETFEQFFTGDNFSHNAMKLWKEIFR